METLEKMRAKRPSIKLGPFNFVMGGKDLTRLTVSMAGLAGANARYTQSGLQNGKPLYLKNTDATVTIGWDGTKWVLSAGGPTAYTNASADVDASNWILGGIGTLPVPMVSAG